MEPRVGLAMMSGRHGGLLDFRDFYSDPKYTKGMLNFLWFSFPESDESFKVFNV